MFQARRALITMLACGALAASPVAASAATTIDTGVSSSLYTCQWGYPNTATYGQVIAVPQQDSLLDGFSFYVMQFRDGVTGQPTLQAATINYRAYVYGWDGSKAVGGAVWASGPRVVETTPGSTAAQEIAIDTDGLALTPGVRYVLFLSISEDYALHGSDDKACFAAPETKYTGGPWAFQNNADDTTWWTTRSWSSWADGLAFKASLSSPPLVPIYDFDGFYAPVSNRDANGHLILNEVKGGQAIPVKFSLGGDHGLEVFDDGYPRSQAIACDSQAEVEAVEQTVTAGASSLSYASGSDTYTYVWKTSDAWEDSCRQLVLRFDDGQTARANFKFK